MALLTANGADVLAATIHLPRVGPWQADLVVDQLELSGFEHAVTLNFGEAGVSLSGSFVRGGVFVDKLRLRICAGAAQLYKTQVTPKAYQGVPLRIPLIDLLNAAGEQLSSTADQGMLGTVLQKWVAVHQGAIAAVTSLLKPFGASWRMLFDGSFWFGTESWPTLEPAHMLMDEQLDVGRVEIAPELDADLLRPGVTFLGKQVGRVEHRVDGAGLRTIVWHE